MTARQVLGAALIAIPGLFILTLPIMHEGWRVVLKMWLAVAVIVGMTGLGAYLLVGALR